MVDLHLSKRFKCAAEQHPGRCALEGAGRSLTYGQLLGSANAIANAFLRDGLSPGDRVLLVFRNTPEFIESYLGCALANLVSVAFYPEYGPAVLSAIAERTGATMLLSDGSPRTRAIVTRALGSPATLRVVDFGDRVGLSDEAIASEEWIDCVSDAHVTQPDNPDDVMVILCSSGTTGTIKLIPRTHRRFIGASLRFGDLWGCTSTARFGIGSLITHAAALGWGVHPVLCAGGTLIVEPDRRPLQLFEHFARHQVTDTFLVPSHAQGLVTGARESRRTVALDRVILGGELLAPELATALRRRFNVRLQNTYGMSEGFCTATSLGDDAAIAAGSVGHPCSPEDQVRVLDSEGRPVALGKAGELWVRGPACIDRYWDQHSRLAMAFSADGFFRTGDLVRILPDGSLSVVGRTSLIINRHGVKVSPEAIEMAIKRLGQIDDVVVVGVPDCEGTEQVCAVVQPGHGRDAPTLDRINQGLLDLGAGRIGLPDRLHVVSALPLGPTGKVDRRLVSSLIATGVHPND